MLSAAMFLGQPALSDCSANTVMVKGAFGEVRFTVDLADTPETRAKGLMHRRDLGRFEGMLFIMDQEGPAAFWMRNTLIPLDMIFADAQGRIRKIHENAVPHDETPIPGGDHVAAVLEINGGLSAQLGLKAGDFLQHPSFDQGKTAFPCTVLKGSRKMSLKNVHFALFIPEKAR